MSLTPTESAQLEALWQQTADAKAAEEPAVSWQTEKGTPQYYVLLPCRDERQQIELLQRFQAEGLECRALLS